MTGWWWVLVVPAVLAAGVVLTEAAIYVVAWWDERTYELGDLAVKELRAELDDPLEFTVRWLCG